MNPADMPTAVEISGVARTFGAVAAVAGVSLEVRRGEIICLVGHSGCGKSTLLRMIAGVEPTDTGRIALAGKEVSGPSAFVEPELRNIGFVFQDYALFPHLTVRENVLFGLKRRPKSEAGAMAAAVIDRVGIGHLAERYPHMLSGGEQQRVALARALAPRPDILLMDEPFSNLDRGLRDAVRERTLSLLRSLGTTVIMVTHDPEEALSAGDRVVLMRAGRIVQIGSGYDLYDRPESPYAAEFFCSFNKVPGIYRNGFIETAIGRFARPMALAEGAASTLFVAPQGVVFAPDTGDIEGTITGRSFHGEIEQLLVSVDGLAEPLRVRTTTRIPRDATRARLAVVPERLLAFPRESSAVG
jgi:iron(III) transport system ATP-binding protein